MENETTIFNFILLGLSNFPSIQHQIFLLFLLTYLMTLIGNLLILLLIFTDSHLHTPMYFFLGNLACIDICYSQVTGPQMLYDFCSTSKTVSFPLCLLQGFFFLYFCSNECFLLSVMSYDRYVAICHPLHYINIMKWKVCTQLAVGVWGLGALCSLTHTLCTLRLEFCGPNTIHSFFCDLPLMWELSCTDTFLNMLMMFILGGSTACAALVATFLPYVYILNTVQRIKIKKIKHKTFSNCIPHLATVFIFHGSLSSTYFRPSVGSFEADIAASMVYAVISPLLFLQVLHYSRAQLVKTFPAITDFISVES
ncbi:olfactory receptor 5V1-like [Discoglossus pictus]